MKKVFIISLIIFISIISQKIISQSKAIIIDHTSHIKFESINDTTLQKVIQLKMMFRHASIGFAIIDGLECLQGTKPQAECKIYPQYKYDRRNWSFQGRGNSGWYGKVDDFVTEVEKQINDYDIFAFKYCYLDGLDELAEPCGKPIKNEKVTQAFNYLKDNMEMLEAKYKNKYFVWWTIPLTQIGQLCTDTLNSLIRTYCKTNNKILFDIADIECHDTLGNLVTNQNGWEIAYKPYCGEQKPDAQACHPGRMGAMIIGKAMWVMVADILNRDNYSYIKPYGNSNKNNLISIIPNPTNDFIYIKTNSPIKSKIEIYSMLGIKLFDSYYQEKIDISFLLSGVYFLKIDNINYRFIKL